MRWAGGLAVIGVLAMLGVTACASSSHQPTPSPTASRPAASASPTASYHADGLRQLCTSTDVAPVAALQLRIRSKSPQPAQGGSGSACFYDMLTATGEPASVFVAGATFASTAAAKHFYDLRTSTVPAADLKPLTGLGEQAVESTLQEALTGGLKQTTYSVSASDANLYVEVEIAVSGGSPAATQTLAGPARALVTATLRAGRGG